MSQLSIGTLFDTWSVAQVNYSLYDVNKFKFHVSWVYTHHYSGIYGLLKLIFPDILPDDVSKIIVLDADIIFNGNILELWLIFNNFNKNQFIGLIENESDFYLSTRITHWPAIGRGYNTGVILYDLKYLRKFGWHNVWHQLANTTISVYGSASLADQDVINAVIAEYPQILFRIDCNWNIQLSDNNLSFQCYRNNPLKAIHWNSPRKLNVISKDNGFFKSLYARYAELNGNNDVTFVTQFSYDRLYLLSELFTTWEGPMCLTLYATDREFQEIVVFLDSISILKERKNIAFHVVFKDGDWNSLEYPAAQSSLGSNEFSLTQSMGCCFPF
ncbi:hypothetical protein Trydic_g9838 [Trypoxylus dichotomus]